jgi:hypothetical protein
VPATFLIQGRIARQAREGYLSDPPVVDKIKQPHDSHEMAHRDVVCPLEAERKIHTNEICSRSQGVLAHGVMSEDLARRSWTDG